MELQKIVTIILLLNICLHPSKAAHPWIKVGYWQSFSSGIPISEINSGLFTHLVYSTVGLDYSSYELSISSTNIQLLAKFTSSVKQTNPSVTTLLSILINPNDDQVENLSSLLAQSSYRKSFIDSSIRIARLYGFQGLDFVWRSWVSKKDSDMKNMGKLFEDWRVAINDEARISSRDKLILTCVLPYLPHMPYDNASYPVDSIRNNIDWVTLNNYEFHMPFRQNFTGAHTALYAPSSEANTNSSVMAWIGRGLPASKIVLGLGFFGFSWTLLNQSNNGIGAPTTGPAFGWRGVVSYRNIEDYIERNDAQVRYNATYVSKYLSVGLTWICFDDAQTIKTKVSYAMDKNLLGYSVWQIAYDSNSMLSLAAAPEGAPPSPSKSTKRSTRRRLLLIVLASTATLIFIVGFLLFHLWMRVHNSKEKLSKSVHDDFNRNHSILQVFSLQEIKLASNGFSDENKVGEGGYGPVYRGVLSNGREIAVKKLSKSSTQGIEELKNEINLTALLQHVNLVKVLGFCIEGDEQMLIYEYMPNKSLDKFLFDPIRRGVLDWKKRVDIIEGVTQGLLYLQEYSRLTIVHRDLKPSNILLDNEMKPKISDFGMARIFTRDRLEANTDRFVGTYGYVPPEYERRGIYSTKLDVYSFGVLLLQILSGKRNASTYGPNEDLSLLEYAYELWKDGKGMEFMDPILNDTLSSCKLMKCMQIALLCVQKNANDRPSMLEVFSMLKNENTAMGIPQKPAFSCKNEEHNQEQQLNIGSVDKATITVMVAR
ncbi:hypothetical protein UlMin_036939 [Ulmus minor]